MTATKAGATCPDCGGVGYQHTWRRDGDIIELEYLCFDIECKRSRDPWFVRIPAAEATSPICPVCTEAYLQRTNQVPGGHGLYIHELLLKDLTTKQVTKGCFYGQAEDFAVGG